jgi:oligopeptidase B
MITNKGACIMLLFFILNFMGCSDSTKNIEPPKAEKIKKELTIHGDTRIDYYYWLKNRESQKVIDYLEAENEYTNKVMFHTVELQDKLYNEIISRIEQDDESVPYKFNGYFYYERYEPEKEYPVFCRKKDNLNNVEEILVNVNELAEGKSFTKVVGLEVSPNNKILAYGEDYISRRKYTIRFKNLESGELLDDKLQITDGNVAWANDNKTVFYTKKDETLRPYKVFKHILGTDPKNDQEVYHESDSTFTTNVYKSKSQKYILIFCESTLSTESRFLDADNPDGKFKIIQKREKDLEYHPKHYKNKFYIRTNYKAQNFRIVSTSVNKTDKKFWKDLIPHRENVLVEDLDIFQDYYVIDERFDGLSQLRIKSWDNKTDYYVEFEEPAYAIYTSKNLEFNTQLVRYVYSSLTTPKSTYDFNMKSKKKDMLKREKAGADFNPEDYKTERIKAVAKDGVEVPISLVYKKSLKKQGGNPLLLHGYGSYGSSSSAYFKSSQISLLDRGFIYAIAHVRGGQEMGRWWYEDGKLFKKKNTFTDFIACADFLIKEKYTSKDKLFARGGSAGGLLMGAISNLRPDLFKGIVSHVPWVDVITTMLDPGVPLTSVEYDEWGDPNKKDYYDYMLSYSPYDNVEAKNYPALLVTTGLHDSQVQYWEPAKWVAKLREFKTDKNLLILKTDMESGHGGASGRFKKHKETAFEYAFLLDQIGIKE